MLNDTCMFVKILELVVMYVQCTYNNLIPILLFQLHYAVLQTLPAPTGIYIAEDDSCTPYALVS